MSPVESAAVKAGASLAGVMILSARIVRSKRPLDWFGIIPPPLLPTLAFVALIMAWAVGTDLFTHWRGPWDFRPWREAPPIASALRIVAVCLLGPTVEELLFRGLIFSWLRERVGIPETIGITAVSWGLLHYNFAWWIIFIIAVAGVIHGIARWRTGSVFAPIAMHCAYNLYAIW
jgi:membrane protease YdiL (CAAX protease family)